jgi:hypothetical protein
MPNNFTFFGEVFDQAGKRTAAGKIVTFSGGDPMPGMRSGQSSNEVTWDASTANTLEDITAHKAFFNIKHSGRLILAIPHDPKLGLSFKFTRNTVLPRFSITIQEPGRALARLDFLELVVGTSFPVIRKNLTLNGVLQEFAKLSVNVVNCFDPRGTINLVPLAGD